MAVDMFLKIDGIKGESKDDKHKEEIQIDSFSWGLSQTGSFSSGGGGGAGKVAVGDISVMKTVDTATCALMLACCNGKHIKEAHIVVRKAGEKPLEYLKIKLEDILVSSIQHGGSAHGDLVTESLSLNFAKFSVDYFQQKPDGTGENKGTLKWDVKANTKG